MSNSPTSADPNLIFDLGMHTALDTKFYLDKGFRVVALEANPYLVEKARSTHEDALRSGRLTIIDRALSSEHDGTISFFLNHEKYDWSSTSKHWAEKGGHRSEEIKVGTVVLGKMFDLYGVPHYIKCDIEGSDDLFCRQLLADERRPTFVSIEAISLDCLAILYACGYDHVQIINQALNWAVNVPDPPREGQHVPVQFNGHMSGLFGRELNPDAWLSFDQAVENYVDFRRLSAKDRRLAHGWLDFHVTARITLQKNKEVIRDNDRLSRVILQ